MTVRWDMVSARMENAPVRILYFVGCCYSFSIEFVRSEPTTKIPFFVVVATVLMIPRTSSLHFHLNFCLFCACSDEDCRMAFKMSAIILELDSVKSAAKSLPLRVIVLCVDTS